MELWGEGRLSDESRYTPRACVADLRRRIGPVLAVAVAEGDDGCMGVPISLVVDSNGERVSDTGLMLALVPALDMILRGTAAIIVLDKISVDTPRITIATESRISDIVDLES